MLVRTVRVIVVSSYNKSTFGIVRDNFTPGTVKLNTSKTSSSLAKGHDQRPLSRVDRNLWLAKMPKPLILKTWNYFVAKQPIIVQLNNIFLLIGTHTTMHNLLKA